MYSTFIYIKTLQLCTVINQNVCTLNWTLVIISVFILYTLKRSIAISNNFVKVILHLDRNSSFNIEIYFKWTARLVDL